jgi:hypothetical protein
MATRSSGAIGREEEVEMKSLLKKSILLAGVVLLAGSASARADSEDLMVVKVPFPFVVEGRTLPAGQYVVEREEPNSSVLLLRGERGNRAFSFVPTVPAGGHDPAGDRPTLSFTRQGKEYRLASVWESASEGQSVVGK